MNENLQTSHRQNSCVLNYAAMITDLARIISVIVRCQIFYCQNARIRRIVADINGAVNEIGILMLSRMNATGSVFVARRRCARVHLLVSCTCTVRTIQIAIVNDLMIFQPCDIKWMVARTTRAHYMCTHAFGYITFKIKWRYTGRNCNYKVFNYVDEEKSIKSM